MKIWLSRWVTASPSQNIQRLDMELEEASRSNADVIVLPELFLTGYKGSLAPGAARNRFSALSGKYPGKIILFGTVSEEGRNRATLWAGGREILRYDKVNLFLPNREDDIWEPGDCYSAAETPFGRIGVAICNDIRFPEAARTLRLEQRIEMLIVPAWWPWRRNGTWKALLKARAIENAVYVAGCCIAAAETENETFAGAGNYFFDPLGNEIGSKDDRSYEAEMPFTGEVLVDPLKTGVRHLGSRLFKI